MKIIKYIFAVCVGLLILSFVEILFSGGYVLQFDTYSVFGWIVQFIAIVGTVCASILITHNELENWKKL